MSKTTSVTVLAAASLVGIASAFADAGAKPSPFTPRFFADVELGYAKSRHSLYKSGMTGGADFGYQFSSNFAVDAGFLFFPKSTYTFMIPGGGEIVFKNNYIANLALRVILPIQKFALYGEIGPGLGHVSEVFSDGMATERTHGVTRAVLFGAIGADYQFTDKISLGIKGIGTTSSASIPQHWAILANLGFHFSA